MINIRQENVNDYKTIYKLVKDSFETAEYTDGGEQDLVERLRKGDSYVPELTLVAEKDGEIVGFIMYTKVKLGNTNSIELAPLAIRPDCQKQGIGALLINESHKIAKDMGFDFSIVVGYEKYYPKFGYGKGSEFGILPPFDLPDENFMAINLQEKNIKLDNQKIEYAKEFFE